MRRIRQSSWTPGALVAALLLIGPPSPLRDGPVPAQAVESWLPRYDLRPSAAAVSSLPRELVEVSGLAFDARGRLFAHDDDRGRIHHLDPATGAVVRTIWIGAPDLHGDFGGLAIAGPRFFLITSDGTLLVFEEPAPGYAARYRRLDTGLGGRCELEGLAYDAATDALLAPCKVTRAGALSNRLAIFSIPLRTLRADSVPRVAIRFDRLGAPALEEGFHPSSIEVHPRSGSLFLVSAQEESVIELAPDGSVIAVRPLTRGRHPQPEGLTFGPDLALWIADEGGNGRGSITRYPVRGGSVGGGIAY
jgi:uncharacterized protein YjiK